MKKVEKKRGRPKKFNNKEVLQAAVTIFLKKGYESTSLDDLSKELSINKPSLYAAFGNKEEIFLKVLSEYYSVYENFFSKLIAEELTVGETIEKWFNWFLENFKSQELPLGCLIVNSSNLCSSNNSKISQQIQKFHENNEKMLADYLNSKVASGEIPRETNPIKISRYYNCIIQGLAVLQRSNSKPEVLEDIVKTAIAITVSSRNLERT